MVFSPERHLAVELFGDAGFDLEPLERALERGGYRPFDLRDVAFVDAFLAELVGLLGRRAVVDALRATEFVEDADALLFSLVEAAPLVALRAAAAADAPEPVLRTLMAGVAENPDGAAHVVRALRLHGVSEQAVAAIFDRAHSRVHGWRLYFVLRRLVGEEEARLADLAQRVASDEPSVFASPHQVVRTVAAAVEDETLLVEREGRGPSTVVRAAWAAARPIGELLAEALARVLEHRAFTGADRPEEIGERPWRCRR
jgi:hypothetical protein